MGEVAEVKLQGYWASSDCAMVRHALKLKGVAFEYEEVDIFKNGESIVKVYEKVPVLVVDGKSISNPLVIYEYIEETWKNPALFPEDPYLRSRVRFWTDFFYKMIMPTSFDIVYTHGQAQEKATKDFIDHMTTLEDGISKDFANGGPFIHGEKPGLLDVMMGSCPNGLKALGAVPGVELLDEKRMPRLSSAMAAFLGLEMSTEIEYEPLLELHWAMREKALAMSATAAQ